MPPDFSVVQRTDLILDRCAGKKVLHLGCTNYPYTEESIDKGMLLHTAIEKVASAVYGFDADQAGIDILEKLGSKNIHLADLENLASLNLKDEFDVIVA